jgi:hypothetical protein
MYSQRKRACFTLNTSGNYVARNDMISRQTVPYIRQNNGTFSLDKNHDYYYQVQGQRFCAEKKKCFFIVYTFSDILFFSIERNDTFISEMLEKLKFFYENHFRAALLEKKTTLKHMKTVIVQNKRLRCSQLSVDFNSYNHALWKKASYHEPYKTSLMKAVYLFCYA